MPPMVRPMGRRSGIEFSAVMRIVELPNIGGMRAGQGSARVPRIALRLSKICRTVVGPLGDF